MIKQRIVSKVHISRARSIFKIKGDMPKTSNNLSATWFDSIDTWVKKQHLHDIDVCRYMMDTWVQWIAFTYIFLFGVKYFCCNFFLHFKCFVFEATICDSYSIFFF